ncbi:sigma-54-dependent Fis family transcriptional regulator [Desulfurispora thermophila]|uniref:sigma-54-dependent Fis family transcriptional regulator n=1 Tax=Desulfurispora thermophila TaxID=265470 RepID=UPI00037552E1|nr:sigma-54-dependent Fis family transcriptional regulator [Desulfurispora thermophila]
MYLKDMIRRDVPSLKCGDTLRTALFFFRSARVDSLPVVDEQSKLLGVLTRTDLFDALLQEAGLNQPVDKYYRRDVVAVPGNMPYEEVMENVRTSPVGSAPVLDESGCFLGMFTKTNMVITLLKQSDLLNARLKAILDALPNAVLAVDRWQRLTLLNRAAETILGLDSARHTGEYVQAFLPGLSVEKALHGQACLGQRVNLGHLTLLANILPVPGGEEAGAVIVLHDIIELEKMAQELEMWKDMLVGESTVMRRLKEEIYRVAQTVSTVLITGESGTGKELVARAIHRLSPRARGPFVTVNCAAIPEALLESEMFGYAPGAFTGADRAGKPGRFVLADGGTLFLDEIGDMSLVLQAKLLRVLQDREIVRVGDTKPQRVDVRIIAATNQDLGAMIKQGRFREDLFFRLNVIGLQVPPLRQRGEDIDLLVRYFIDRFNKALGASVSGIGLQVRQVLYSYHWPGNVRELENVVERAVVYAKSGRIGLQHLPAYLLGGAVLPGGAADREKDDGERALPGGTTGQAAEEGAASYRERLEQAEREMILSALRRTGGNKARAARLLNMSRSRLYTRLERLKISCPVPD